MPKDPTRNIENYQLRGGHLNEFEYQKNQGEMTTESEPPLTENTQETNRTQKKRLKEVAAEAHRKVEKRKRLGLVKAATRKGAATARKSSKKSTRRPAKKTTARTGTKKRTGAKRSRQRTAANR